MYLSASSGAAKAAFFSFKRVLFFFFCTVLVSASPVEANIPGKVTFSWQANPPEDYVIGYRLYFGAYSRFNSSGAPKSNFSYTYYIDFADQMRCDGDGTSCEIINSEALQCVNLYEGSPLCTVSKLHGNLYFALTAYNAQSESGFTSELNLTVNPEGLAAVQQTVTTLLLKK